MKGKKTRQNIQGTFGLSWKDVEIITEMLLEKNLAD